MIEHQVQKYEFNVRHTFSRENNQLIMMCCNGDRNQIRVNTKLQCMCKKRFFIEGNLYNIKIQFMCWKREMIILVKETLQHKVLYHEENLYKIDLSNLK